MVKYKTSELIKYITDLQGESDLEWGIREGENEMCKEICNRLLELENIKGGN